MSSCPLKAPAWALIGPQPPKLGCGKPGHGEEQAQFKENFHVLNVAHLPVVLGNFAHGFDGPGEAIDPPPQLNISW